MNDIIQININSIVNSNAPLRLRIYVRVYTKKKKKYKILLNSFQDELKN